MGQEGPLCSEDVGLQRLGEGGVFPGGSSRGVSDSAAQVGPWGWACGEGGLARGSGAVAGGVGTEAWLRGRAGSVYLAGPPSGIAHLVSETFSRRKEPRVRRGRAMEAALCEGTGR